MILLYENQSGLDNAIATYINEGLKREQLCVLASVNLNNKDYLQNFSSQITNYQENIEKGNLLIIDLALFYVQAMVGNLEPFDKLKQEATEHANKENKRTDKHVRLTSDCGSLLFKNQHFNECISLEEWFNQEPFQGSCISPYPKNLVNQYPWSVHVTKLFKYCDVILD